MKIGIICSLDKFANGIRPNRIKNYLEKKGHEVHLINTHHEQNKLSPFLRYIAKLYVKLPLKFKQFLLARQFKIKGELIYNIIKDKNYNCIICENPWDAYVLTKDLKAIKIYDSPSPWFDELFYSRQISDRVFQKLKKLELEIYHKVDYLCFHWDNYTRYVQKNTYNGKNMFIMNWGSDIKPPEKKAKYSYPPKVVFLGNLDGYWNNLPLLSQLAKQYTIDVYGAPAPDKKYGLNYKGYAPSTDVLSKYQFGLITITKDELRKHSFSSKHIEYLSYGLPVLTPEWRDDPSLSQVSIPFNEHNFSAQIQKYSNRSSWERLSNMSYAKANSLSWEEVLKPLDKIIK